MKLNDLKSGTYSAVRVLEPSNKAINSFIKFHKIPVSQSPKERRKHVTLLYSRNYLSDFHPDPTIKHVARFLSYELFDTKAGKEDSTKCLVMKLNAPSLIARHIQLMAAHPLATYDFPTYQPHITLSYTIPLNFDVGQIPPFADDIILGEEYSEDLEL